MEQSKPPRVFISYSWESEDHKRWVRYLGESLRKAGIETRLDQWEVRPGESFTMFMEQEVEAADFVLVVCTPSYARKSNNRQGGVGYEQQIVSGKLMSGTARSKFIPILRKGDYDPGPDCAIPTHFLGIAWIEFRDDAAFEESLEDLVRVIFSKPRFAPPPLGARPSLETVTATLPNQIRLTESDKSNGDKGRTLADHSLVAGIKEQAPGEVILQPVKNQAIPPVSASIVRSWFKNVINPILSQLRQELPYLEKKKWSWQVSPRRLECIRQIDFSLTHAEDTFNQLLSFYPDIKEMFRLYEQGVRDLYEACDDLQNEIKKSEDLKAVFETAKADITKTPSGEPINGVFSNLSDEDHHLENLVHYIVVSAGELPVHNSHRFVWSKYRDQFLALLERPGIRQKKQQMDEAGDRLLMAVREFIDLLVETKTPLSLAFGEPV